MAKEERAGKGEHHSPGQPERPLPFKILKHKQKEYDDLPSDVQKAAEELFPHADKMFVRLESIDKAQAYGWLLTIMSCLYGSLEGVRKFKASPLSHLDLGALNQLPDAIRAVIVSARTTFSLHEELAPLLKNVPEIKREGVRQTILRALMMDII